LNASREAEQDQRRRILCELSVRVAIRKDGRCLRHYGVNIELGERVFFNFNCVVLDVCSVRIGSFSLFGPAVQIYTAMHPLDPELRRRQEFGKPVEIGSDVWVGGGAIILPGVTIGARAVIGAGSIMTRDVPASVLLRPCRDSRDQRMWIPFAAPTGAEVLPRLAAYADRERPEARSALPSPRTTIG
jgi:maltose O-acetyltransferase